MACHIGAPGRERSRSLPRSVAFWLVAFATAILTAASSAPLPGYPGYQDEFQFPEITLKVIFAVYIFALMMSLLTVGRLSDYVGRRVVLAGALLVEAASLASGIAWRLPETPAVRYGLRRAHSTGRSEVAYRSVALARCSAVSNVSVSNESSCRAPLI